MRFKPVRQLKCLNRASLHLWRIDLDEVTLTKNWQEILDFDEIKKAKGFYFDKHRKVYIKSHLALRRLLALYLNAKPYDISFAKEAYGKPYIVSPKTNVKFNLSHSGSIAFVGVNLKDEIGVDVEKIKGRDVTALASRFFSKTEARSVIEAASLEEQERQFFQIWAQKESFIKALGKGLGFPLDKFSTPLENEPRNVASSDLEGKDWWVSSFMESQYSFAWCSEQKDKLVNFFHYDENYNE